MIEFGRMNRLVALRMTSVGMFLNTPDGDPYDDVLLPNKYVPTTLREHEEIDVFAYFDSEDRPVATTRTPYIQRDEFAVLEVVSTTSFGAFLDWGLEKDLLVPHREQPQPMQIGRAYPVFLYQDQQTGRLVASGRINRFLDEGRAPELSEGEAVDLLVYERSDLGFNTIVNNRYRGLLYNNELFKPLRPGDRPAGWVKRIRDDYRIDLTVQQPGYAAVESNVATLFDALQKNGGFLPLTDATDPKIIYQTLEMSKKTFKKAVGALYRERKLAMEPDGIRLLER